MSAVNTNCGRAGSTVRQSVAVELQDARRSLADLCEKPGQHEKAAALVERNGRSNLESRCLLITQGNQRIDPGRAAGR